MSQPQPLSTLAPEYSNQMQPAQQFVVQQVQPIQQVGDSSSSNKNP